jgi:hypothetical protein
MNRWRVVHIERSSTIRRPSAPVPSKHTPIERGLPFWIVLYNLLGQVHLRAIAGEGGLLVGVCGIPHPQTACQNQKYRGWRIRRPPVVRKNCITPLDAILSTCENRRRRSPVLQKDALAMTSSPDLFRHLVQFSCILLTLLGDVVRFLRLCLRSPAFLAAGNLFLRKQRALYQERHVKPRRATNATRLALIWRGRWFEWRQALTIVQPETFLHWHRQGFRLFWRWTSRIAQVETMALDRSRFMRQEP